MVQQPRNRRQWSDSTLLSAIAARDGAAFAVFYRRQLPAELGFQAIALDDGDLDRIEEVADERPYPEIAGELRCSELVIRKRVSRGLARMREQLRNSIPPARSA
ncbi:MAG TPA: hypothetical protein VMA96_12480 [Solirubrobacteraceae bacterium]|nr:hypothetical protein [Solirubrobacteraceae bacterium]